MKDPRANCLSYVDAGLAKILSHSLRAHILCELNKRVMSPKSYSERFGEPLSKVCYHFDVLTEGECLELVHEEPRGNLTEHYYRATKRALFDDKSWARLPETIRNKLSGRTIGDLVDVLAEAMEAETFDARTDRHAAWEKCPVDERGWEEMSAIQLDAAERLIQAAQEARARLVGSGELGMNATWATLLFESPFEEREPPR
jgi:DNA-binding transcriptional ArsR family regulator